MNKIGCVLETMVGRLWFGEQQGGEVVQKEQLAELVKLGFDYYSNGKNKEAIDYFKQALKVCERADIYNYLGMVYIRSGDYAKAVNAYKKALDIDRSFIPAYYNLGITLYYGRNYEQAVKIFDDISRIEGLEPFLLANAHNDKGCALNRKGSVEAAEKSFEAALVLDDTFVRSYVNLGNLYCNKGKFDDAKVKYNKAIELDEKCAAAYNGLGVIAIEEGDLDKAGELFDKALAFDNRCQAAHINNELLKKRKEAREQIAKEDRQEQLKKEAQAKQDKTVKSDQAEKE